jgi:hypothetical protein
MQRYHLVGARAGRPGHALRVDPRRALPGLHLAAHSLQANMRELIAAAPLRSVDVRRLCAASFSAGRVIGYLEALEATDQRLARAVASELGEALESVDDARRRFERAAE